MAVIFLLGCSSTQKDDMFKNLGSWLCGSTCHQCKQGQQPGTVLLAPVGKLVLAHSGNFALARCCSSAPAHWNIVALAHSGNSVWAHFDSFVLVSAGSFALAPASEQFGTAALELELAQSWELDCMLLLEPVDSSHLLLHRKAG